MDFEDVLAHYSRRFVGEAVSDFCRGRWVALEGSLGGERVFIRYRGSKPLTIDSASDVATLITLYRNLNIRTVYATMHVYRKLDAINSIEDVKNVVASTPFWDIDIENLDMWRYAVEAAEAILSFLEGYGVRKSVYFVWSGMGMHVRINENALLSDVNDFSMVEIAHAIVDYVLDKVREKLGSIVRKASGLMKIENVVDSKRVFTAPLSLHRKVDLVAVAISPKDLPSFDISWASIENPRYSDAWRDYVVGEAENLVREAIKILSNRRVLSRNIINTESSSLHRISGEIPRFQVMALLQAARYYVLTGDLEKAMSFGLNRAIFYAYLKYYGRGAAARNRRVQIEGIEIDLNKISEAEQKIAKPVKDGAELSERGFFMIGGKEQTREDFERHVVRKIEAVAPFDLVWEAAIKYISRFPRNILEDPQKFYKHAYEPVREGFIAKVVEEIIQHPQQEVKVEKPRSNVNAEPLTKHSSLLKWVKKPEKKSPQKQH